MAMVYSQRVEEIKTAIARRLSKRIYELGIKRIDVCKKTNIRAGDMSRLLNCEDGYSLHKYIRVAEELGFDVDIVLTPREGFRFRKDA